MIKNLIFIFNNKINHTSNFYNCLLQLNINIINLKIYNKNYYIHIINIYIIDSFYKINQFLKLIKKYLSIKILSIKKKVLIFLFTYYYNNKIKFFKNFFFINKYKKIIFCYNLKKTFYVNSILNNFIYFKKNIL